MRVIRFHDGEGYRTAVAKDGYKLVHLIAITSSGVRKIDLPSTDAQRFTQVMYKGAPYPVDRACRKMLVAGRALGIDKGAKAILKKGLV